MTAPAHHVRDALEVRAMLHALDDALAHPGFVANLAGSSPEGLDASLFIAHAYMAGARYGFEVGRDVRTAAPPMHRRARRRKNSTRKAGRR
jgi:hypothetical protein